MASKTSSKRKSPLKEKESTGRFVATKGRQKNPKYSFENDLEYYNNVYADYNYIPGASNDFYGLAL